MKNKDIIDIIRKHKESAAEFQERRRPDWNENYSLYRDKVITNRLTQRQTVNVPLMKSAMTTLIKEIDELPLLYFDNLDNDEQKEIFYNEYWSESAKFNKHATKDIVDKKQAFLCGRTFKKQNIVNGRHVYEIVDTQNMLVDRFVDPTNIDTARCIIQKGIYRPVSQLERDETLSKSAIGKIKQYFATQEGLIKAEENFEEAVDAAQRWENLGLEDVWNPALGETYLELWEVYLKQYDEDLGEEVFYLYTVADIETLDEPLKAEKLCDVLGHTEDNFWYDHTPFTSWATDPEHLDFWSDGPADIIRGANKIANSMYSQLLENRQLRNFNMNYYDSTNKDFSPQTFIAEPWGWYPMPGNPKDIVMPVPVADLSESLDELEFVLNLAKEAVAATSTSQGAVETNVTLGEVQLALQNAQERVRHISVFYTEAWEDFGRKYIKLLEGNSHLLDPIKVTKKGRQGRRNYTRIISPEDWVSKSGYRVDVKMLGDKQAEDVEQLQKLNFSKNLMPANPALDEIMKKKSLEFAGLGMNEIKTIMDAERQMQEMMANSPMLDPTGVATINPEMQGLPPMQPAAQPYV